MIRAEFTERVRHAYDRRDDDSDDTADTDGSEIAREHLQIAASRLRWETH